MAYKRKKKYNDAKPKDVKVIELYLKKINELRTNERED